MEIKLRRLSRLRNAVVAVFVLAVVAGILLPIYTDEVGWRLQERAAFDGVDKLFTELCGPNTLARPPFWMMPARAYSYLFNTLFPAPLYVRLSGILYALGWTAMLLTLVRRIGDTARDRIQLSMLAIGFLALGTMPLLLVWSRPEQPILLALTGAIMIACTDLGSSSLPSSASAAWLRSLVVLAFALIAMSYHVKAIFAVPVFLACLYFASRGPRANLPRAIAGALILGAAAWAAQYWLHRLACPGDPTVLADHERNNAGAALATAHAWSQLTPVAMKALGNISLFQYLGMPAPREEPMSYWLEPYRIGLSASFTWFLEMVLVWAITLLIALYCLLVAARRAWRKRELEPKSVIACLLVAAALGWSVTQGFRNVYEASFIVPMMVIAVVLALSTYDNGRRLAGAVRALSVTVGLGALLSVPLVAALYGSSLLRASSERGYLKQQPYSVSGFGFAAVEREALAAGRKCGIVDPAKAQRLLIDDVTYFPYMKSRLPEHRGGLFSELVTRRDPIDYLRSIRSDGIVVTCRALPPELQARARRTGQFCCLAPPNF